MKNIIILFFALVIAVAAQAQSRYKTDVSIRSQLTGNSVPGAVYRDASVKNSKAGAVAQQGAGAQIRGNAVPGVRYKTSNSGGGAATT